MGISRCEWPGTDALMIRYHDEEWGVPLHDDKKLFEFMVLDAFQAGLSWKTILHRREAFREAFAGFDPGKVACFGAQETAQLMHNERIIRNRLKINGTIKNARLFLAVQAEYGSFDKYIWQFTNGKTVMHQRKANEAAPVTSPESDAMSSDLRQRGFTFVGSTICYAFMQAAGMVNDHLVTCFCYRKK